MQNSGHHSTKKYHEIAVNGTTYRLRFGRRVMRELESHFKRPFSACITESMTQEDIEKCLSVALSEHHPNITEADLDLIVEEVGTVWLVAHLNSAFSLALFGTPRPPTDEELKKKAESLGIGIT